MRVISANIQAAKLFFCTISPKFTLANNLSYGMCINECPVLIIKIRNWLVISPDFFKSLLWGRRYVCVLCVCVHSQGYK